MRIEHHSQAPFDDQAAPQVTLTAAQIEFAKTVAQALAEQWADEHAEPLAEPAALSTDRISHGE